MITLKIASIHDEQMIKDYIEAFQLDGETIEGNVGMVQYMAYADWHFIFSDSKTDRTHLIIHNDIMVGTIDFRFDKGRRQINTLGMIGYAVSPLYRGKGYASAALRAGVESYPADVITITCLKTNFASSHVIENAGGILQKEFLFDGEPSLRYLITKTQNSESIS